MDIAYTVIKRDIKNPRLEFKHGDLFVIVPTRGSFDVRAFVERHRSWIAKHAKYFEKLKNDSSALLLEPRLAAEFEQQVRMYLREAETFYDVSARELRFKSMRSRWGSCTSLDVVTINLRLRYFSDEIISYVVHHEVVHLRARKHDQTFYKLLAQKFPNYKQLDKILVAYEYLLIKSGHR